MTSRTPSAPGQTPEQEELQTKWREFGELRAQLPQLELEVQTLDDSLRGFEHNYLLRCGSRYITIDVLHAEIAECLAALQPEDAELQARARRARARADRTTAECQTRERTGPMDRVEATPELKALYRRVARTVHPDLASSDAERDFRHDFMVELNAAYRRGDDTRMLQLMVEWERQADAVPLEGVPEQLVRVTRTIAAMRTRIAALELVRRALSTSDAALLRRDIDAARVEGRDLIEELIGRLDAEIELLREELEELHRADPDSAV